MRATTMYFGAALHTPRGGQCPSLLRLKEGAEGREGWRELGRRRKGALRGRERERERQGGRAEGTGAEWKKMNKHPARDGGGELPRSAPVRTLSLLSPFFSRALSSLSLSLSSFSFLFPPPSSLFLSVRHSFSTVPRFRFTMHRWLQRRASYSPSDFLLTSKHGARPREVFFLFPFLPLFLCETYFENAHVYNKGSLRSMR